MKSGIRAPALLVATGLFLAACASAGSPYAGPHPPSVTTVLQSKGLSGSDCVHPSDFETFLRTYSTKLIAQTESIESSPLLYRPPGFTMVTRYEFPDGPDTRQLPQWNGVLRPGETIRACGFAQSDEQTASKDIVQNACMYLYQTRNRENERPIFWLIGPTPVVAGTCVIWQRNFK